MAGCVPTCVMLTLMVCFMSAYMWQLVRNLGASGGESTYRHILLDGNTVSKCNPHPGRYQNGRDKMGLVAAEMDPRQKLMIKCIKCM
jgi:hypothetical protein